MRIPGKNILVTGGSRGIGRGCALELAKAGANVAINYHSSAAAAEEVVREIEALGLRGLAIQADVADQASVEHMIAQVVETFGSLDGFVSNAVYSDREFMVEADMA
ncbi:MAG: SDR family NAD(P)-dependent oxidoreductase, partial [Planctomycetaceae bacterium]